MKPKLFKMQCGDWIPVDRVVAISCELETRTSKSFVSVVMNEGKTTYLCPCATDEEAMSVSNSLGEAVNDYRTNWSILEG